MKAHVQVLKATTLFSSLLCPHKSKAPGTLVTSGNKVHRRANRGRLTEEPINYSFIIQLLRLLTTKDKKGALHKSLHLEPSFPQPRSHQHRESAAYNSFLGSLGRWGGGGVSLCILEMQLEEFYLACGCDM